MLELVPAIQPNFPHPIKLPPPLIELPPPIEVLPPSKFDLLKQVSIPQLRKQIGDEKFIKLIQYIFIIRI